MRIIIFTTVISVLISCILNTNSSFIPKEYQYPEDSLLVGKTFIYRKVGTTDKNFIDLKLKVEDNQKYLISRHYSLNKLLDSTITLNDKTKEIFSFSFDEGKPLKGEIAQDTIIKNGTKLGLRIKRTIFKANDYISDNISKLEYLKDTVFVWKRTKVECIVMRATSTTQMNNNTSSVIEQELTSYHNLYYGKNVGLVRYSTEYKDEKYTFELIEIKGMN